MSETALIDRLAERLEVRPGVVLGIGDDAAMLDDDPATVVTSDVLVEDVHFRRPTSGPRRSERPAARRAVSNGCWRDLGHRALAVNLSDLAAMGARPLAAVVALVLPTSPPLPRGDVEALYDGMEELAARHGVTIAGGDVSAGPAVVLAVTAIGRMPAGVAAPRRAGARDGDLLCVTGTVGGSAAGLLLLDDPALTAALAAPDAARLRTAHLRPEPRLAAGERLAAGGVHALMDCSDGVALDGGRMARASRLGLELRLSDLPLGAGVAEVARAAGREAWELAAAGGEDYELLAALAPADLDRSRRALDVPLTPIGTFSHAVDGLRVERDGAPVHLARLGFTHDV